MLTKQYILSTGLFLDNDYFDIYLQLINECGKKKQYKGKYHKHHIIPLGYYQDTELEQIATKENYVFLLPADHIYAHVLLYMCAATDYARGINKMRLLNAVNNSKMQLSPLKEDSTMSDFFEIMLDGTEVEDNAKKVELIKSLPEFQAAISAPYRKSNSWMTKLRAHWDDPDDPIHFRDDDFKIRESIARTGDKNFFFGKKHTEEVKQQMREYRLENHWYKGRKKVVVIDPKTKVRKSVWRVEEYLEKGYIIVEKRPSWYRYDGHGRIRGKHANDKEYVDN